MSAAVELALKTKPVESVTVAMPRTVGEVTAKPYAPVAPAVVTKKRCVVLRVWPRAPADCTRSVPWPTVSCPV